MLVADFLECPPTPGLGVGVNHRQVSCPPHRGDLFFSRDTASRVQRKARERVESIKEN